MKKIRNRLFLLLILILSLVLGVLGIDWGVPSPERNSLYFSDQNSIKQSLSDISRQDVSASMTSQKDMLSGSRFDPVRSYHPDESNFIKAVSNMKPGKLDFNPHYLYYGTLYIYLFAFALAVCSVSGYIKPTTDILFYFFNPGELAKFFIVGRLVSVVFGVLAVYMVYRIARNLYDEETGLVSALVLAVLPMFVVSSHFMAVDITMCFFVCLAFFIAAKILISPKLKWYMLAGLASGLAADAKYNAGLVLLTVPIADCIREWKGRTGIIVCWFRKKTLVSYMVAAAVFLLLCPFMFLSPGEFGKGMSGGVLGATPDMKNVTGNILFYIKVFYHGMGLPLFLLSVLGAFFVIFKKEKHAWLFLYWMLVNFAIFVFLPPLGNMHMRYMLPVVPVFAIFAARMLAIVKARAGKTAWVILMLVSIVPSFLCSSAYDRVFTGKDMRTAAGEWIAQNIPAGSSIGLRRDPWQYETPPVNQARYRLWTTGRSPEKTAEYLTAKKPDYFVISSAEYLGPSRKWDEVLNNAGYGLAREFYNPPRIFGVAFNYTDPSDDYIYFYPKIRIYRSGKKI